MKKHNVPTMFQGISIYSYFSFTFLLLPNPIFAMSVLTSLLRSGLFRFVRALVDRVERLPHQEQVCPLGVRSRESRARKMRIQRVQTTPLHFYFDGIFLVLSLMNVILFFVIVALSFGLYDFYLSFCLWTFTILLLWNSKFTIDLLLYLFSVTFVAWLARHRKPLSKYAILTVSVFFPKKKCINIIIIIIFLTFGFLATKSSCKLFSTLNQPRIKEWSLKPLESGIRIEWYIEYICVCYEKNQF
jgi:hypothetical protein